MEFKRPADIEYLQVGSNDMGDSVATELRMRVDGGSSSFMHWSMVFVHMIIRLCPNRDSQGVCMMQSLSVCNLEAEILWMSDHGGRV